MRIAIFSYGLPVEGQKRGGIERVAHVLAQGLARRGHAVSVFSHDGKPQGAAYDVQELPLTIRRYLVGAASRGVLGT